jgi:hypothetical protein
MNKRILLLLLICVVAAVSSAGAAERITPPFLIDTETTAYLPLGMGLTSGSMIDPGTFGLSQDLTFVDPGSTLGGGLRVGLEDSPLFGTLTIPVHAVVSAGYNMKLGVGATFLLDEPTTTLTSSPSGLVASGIMSFTWPIAEIGPSYLGLLFGIQGYTWSYDY